MSKTKKDYVDYFLDTMNKEKKHTWRCETRIKSTLDVFAKLRPECIMKHRMSYLYKYARIIVDEVGENDAPTFVRLADDWMRERDLSVDSLKSLEHLLDDWKTGELKDEQSEHERRRYLEGL